MTRSQDSSTAQTLLASESTTKAILETCIDGIVTIDERGTIVSVNSAVERIFGFRSDEIVGSPVTVLMAEPYTTHHDEYLKNYLETGDAKIIGIGREVTGQRKDGTPIPIHLGVGEMRLPEGRFFVGMIRDLTSFKEVQNKLIEAESLAALGEMAASVAHQIKNPLTAVLGVVQILQQSGAIDDEYREVVTELVERVQLLDDTVNRLLVFSKPSQPDAESADLFEITRQVMASLRNEQRFKKIAFSLEGTPQNAQVDLVLFGDVLRNLFYNAADAMPEGGSITASVSGNGKEACVQIHDTGSGMAPEILERVFQPFFTTRSDGTGLGLSLCKKLIEAHGGSIAISSDPGKGTMVSLELPASP